MPSYTQSQASVDQTVRIFDDFYDFSSIVNSSEFDLVYSYFKSTSANSKIAGNFTVFLFRISSETGLSVLDLLSYIQGKNKLEMTALISYYMNSFRLQVSLYGVAQLPQSNQFVSRNIAV
jgi:hypothetical protein